MGGPLGRIHRPSAAYCKNHIGLLDFRNLRQGLGIFKGICRRIPEGGGRKIPQIGWNDLSYPRPGRLFYGVPEHSFVYFVHSYYVVPADSSVITAVTEYGAPLTASVEQGNVFACQFHPEKSAEVGQQILKNFLAVRN